MSTVCPAEPRLATPADETATSDRPILCFDGVCGLCNATIDFLLRRDRDERILFAPLQGETAQRLLPDPRDRQLDTVVLIEPNGRVSKYSGAIARTLSYLPQPWRLLGGLLWVVPPPIRNLGYRIVAGNRYRWFGQKETCRMPTPAERARLLP